MITKGAVLLPRVYRGETTPPSATLEDESRYGSNGTITGAVGVRLPSGLWVLDFDPAIPSYVEIPASYTQLDFTYQDFSIIARVNIDTLGIHRFIFSRGLANTDGWEFYITDNGSLLFRTGQAAANQQSASANGVITTGSWFTVGASRIGASVRVYVNGVDVTTAVGAHIDPVSANRPGVIGYWLANGLYPMDGQIALLKVYNYALSAAQIYSIYNAERSLFGV